MTDVEQYRAILNDGAKEVVQDMIQQDNIKTDLSRWSGIVVSNDDPQKLGRCQIRVMGFYEGIDDRYLPWAVPDIGFLGGKNGSHIIPEVDTVVRGYFDKGDVQRPVYDSIAFNAYNADSDYTRRQGLFDYPHKMVLMETDQGDFLTLNRKTGELVFTHRTGAVTIIDKNGNISIKTGTMTSSNMQVDISGDCNINAMGNVNLDSKGTVNVTALNEILLGNNAEKQLINNVPTCFICGAMHSIGNVQVKA